MLKADPKEIENFAKDSAHWWDDKGPFAPLHRLNPVRLAHIRQQIDAHYGLDGKSLKPFTGLSILDAGCGGGLVCEPMARLGGDVTGVDADSNAIRVARDHAQQGGLDIQYIAGTTFDLLTPSPSPRTRGPSLSLKGEGRSANSLSLKGEGWGEGLAFDVVLALEIAEHVPDLQAFVQSCVDLCKPGGLIIFSTLNRTPKSFALGIVAAEYILRWVPRGTHDWKKFIKPSELARALSQAGATPGDMTGLVYDPLATQNFRLSASDLSVNYFMSATRA